MKNTRLVNRMVVTNMLVNYYHNVCAVYTEEDYRCQGISGNLLNMVVEDMKFKGIFIAWLREMVNLNRQDCTYIDKTVAGILHFYIDICIYKIYCFDEEIRALLRQYIEKAEFFYKNLIGNKFAELKCQTSHYDQHYDVNNYYDKAGITKTLQNFSKETVILNNKEPNNLPNRF